MAVARTVGRISIRVLPDLSEFSTKLKADLKKVESRITVKLPTALNTKGAIADATKLRSELEKQKVDLGVALQKEDAAKVKAALKLLAKDQTAKIKPELDKSAIQKIRGIAGTISTAFGGVSKSVSGALSPLLGGAKGMGLVLLGSSAVSAAGSILSLTASLKPLLGGLALLPAAVLGAGAAFATVKLATSGLGDAFKAAAKGGADYQAALAKLAPSARNFVETTVRLKPAFDNLKKSVQQKFFAGFAQQVAQLARVFLPQLKSGLGSVATAISGLANQFAASIQILGRGGLAVILDNVAKAITAMRPAIDAIVASFSALGIVGSKYLAPLAEAFSGLAQKFNAFIQNAAATGQIDAFIQGAAQAAGQLFSVLKSVVQIFGGLMKAATAAGGATIGTLAKALQSVANVVNSPAFQHGLTAFFQGASSGVSVFLSALKPVGAALAALGPTLGNLAVIAGKTLGGALSAIAKALGSPAIQKGLVTLFEGLSKGILALAPALQPVADALGALAPVAAALAEQLGPILGAALTAIAQAVTTLAPAITPLVNLLGTALLGAVQAVAPLLQVVAQILSIAITQAVNALAPVLPQLVSAFVNLGQTLARSLVPLLPQLAQLLAAVFAAVVPIIPTFAQMLNAITPLIPPLASLIGTILPPLTAMIKALAPLIVVLGTAFILLNSPILAIIAATAALGLAFVAAGKIVKALSGAMSSAWGAIKSFVLSSASASALAVEKAFGAVKRFISDAMKASRAVIGDQIGKVLNLFGHLGGMILNAVGDLGSVLYGAGKAVIEGFLNGIKSSIGKVKSTLSGLTHKLTSWKGPPSTDKVILRNNGQLVIDGFIRGIEDRIPNVKGTLQGLTALVANSATGSVPVGAATAATPPIVTGDVYLDGRKVGQLLDERSNRRNRGQVKVGG